MEKIDETLVLRARDFWASVVLIAASLFFLWKTLDIPLWGENRAGVSGSDWYNSAAIVPLFIFGGLLVLSVVLLVTSIGSGGARQALNAAGIGWDKAEAFRSLTIGLIIFAYVVGLVPRVDFILCSGLLITALIFGFYGGHSQRALVACIAVVAAGFFAFATNPAQPDWNAHGDDWVTLALWTGLTVLVAIKARSESVLRVVPIVAILAPLILVCMMAFVFRQNVPARGGLIFKQIEYHYYVSLRPLWKD
ncbi:hypothetical protein [Ruegeria arenilitoris]|uniref:hypothetical protein n=1 Tax=Ruegeria arenilitoris TaxID=1173585 RepID=UPI00158049B4|nr:hypothetical protein [Ruegeria arenilitoris]